MAIQDWTPHYCDCAVIIHDGGPNEYLIRSPWTGVELSLNSNRLAKIDDEALYDYTKSMIRFIVINTQQFYVDQHGDIDSGFDEIPGRKNGKGYFTKSDLVQWRLACTGK